ncbi:MAG: sulfatase-like hydrolase/transferase, partial [Pirellula sp.]|nr:sulfatase-like hydrolase/transferase [Pirellula sp.]
MHRLALALVYIAAIGWTNLPSAQANETLRPNILFLLADDMRADTIAALGNPHIQTPNIDSLVRSGTSFNRCYIQGGNSGAVCIPSRAMLLTGRPWMQIDTQNLKTPNLMPEWFGSHGYQTFGTGKWHNGKESWLRSFQSGKSVFFGGMSDHTKVPICDLSDEGKLSDERIADSFSSELFADAAIQFLTDRKADKPFFAYVAFTAPHDPRQPPESFAAPYYKKLPPAPVNFLPQHPFDNGMLKNLRDENLAPWPRPEAMIRDQIAEYYGLITHMDEQIGRILKALETSGQRENTIIVFAADNGLALGSHGLLGKQNVYEHSMRVPLIISGPNIQSDMRSDAFAYLLDLFPSLCDLTSMPVPNDLHGKSLQTILSGKATSIRETIFLPYLKVQRAVRDDRWKLIAY